MRPIKAITLWPLLIPVLLLLPGLAAFPYPSPTALYSDISITHYPNAVFLRNSIAEYGQIPLWSPTILSGYPFAANPLSGLWYPPGWLALLFPLPLGFNLMVLVHMLLGGFGMYLLIRSMERSHQAALFGALAFEAMPKIFAHYGAGHLTIVYAIFWTPWLLLADIRSWKSAGSFWLRQPGIVLALIALADPRWAAYAALLWVVFSLVGKNEAWFPKFVAIAKQTAIALALAAPLLIPLFEYSQLATRANLVAADVLAFSLPIAGIFGVLAPQFGGAHEWVDYFGVVVFLFAILTVVSSKKTKMDWLWIGVLIFALLFALGENIPGFELISKPPGFSLLRVPPRIMPLAGIALILLAVKALDSLLSSRLEKHTSRRMRLTFTMVVGLQIGFAILVWLLTKEIPIAYGWGLIISLVFLVLIFLFTSKRINVLWFWIGLLAITLLDLGVTDASLFSPRAKNQVVIEVAATAEFLSRQPGQFRIYSPSYSVPQQTAAEFVFELADGVDPLQLQIYVDFMEQATGVRNDRYSITLPPFANNNPARDNEFAVSDLSKLGLLNVAYIASEFELDFEGLEFIDGPGETFVYRIVDSLPRAFIEGRSDQLVKITKWTPNRIEINASGPGRLVLSEIFYPGWEAFVDGKPTSIETYQQILRSVPLVDGVHKVMFEFRPLTVFAGLAVSLLTIIALTVASRIKLTNKAHV